MKAIENIPAQPGESYPLGFDYCDYLTRGDRVTSVSKFVQESKDPATMPDLVIGSPQIESDTVVTAQVTVDPAAPEGEYVVRAEVSTVKGGSNIVARGILEVRIDS